MIYFFGIEPFNDNQYYDEDKREKISPFIKEDLNRIYNIERFPNRIRREPKLLRKYNLIGNAAIVIGYYQIHERKFKKGSLKNVAIELNKIIDIPVNTLKVKISQLKDYLATGYDKQISYGIINAYKQFKFVPLKKLYKVFYSYEDFTDEQIEERLKLLLTDPTFLNDELDDYDAMAAIADKFNREKGNFTF
jgi:hypothetical protein